MKILLIDDNQKFGQLLIDKFSSYQVENCLTIDDAINSDFSPELILLDVNLGDQRAYNYIGLLIDKYHVPILAISSEVERTTKYLMFENGVVDYIEKPIDFELLKLKIDNLLASTSSHIRYNNLVLNTDSLMIGQAVKLTKNEFIILKYFMTNSEQTIDKKQLLRLLWENEAFVEEAALSTLISRLRKKMQTVDNTVDIKAIRNKGFRLGLKC